MARAVGTMGVVASMVGIVTFANLTSNTVALAPNTLTTGSATLAIGTALGETACANEGTVAPGVSDLSFVPGDTATATFCLHNTSAFPLTVTATIPQVPFGSDAAAATTYTITCGTEGVLTSNLNTWGPGTFSANLPAGAQDACTATATLNDGYDGSGVNTIATFAVNFVGTQVE